VQAWSRLQTKTPNSRLLVVVPELDSSLRDACEGVRPAIGSIVIDSTGAMARRFNAGWLPRAYVLDGSRSVRYVQPPSASDTRAPQQVEALLAADRFTPAQLAASPGRDAGGDRAP
jgi:hypothetical protein